MDEALQKVKEMNLEPLHIEVLPEAKHIFSHIEWRMIGYRIHVSSLEERKEAPFIFIEKKQSEKQYAIPVSYTHLTQRTGAVYGMSGCSIV